MNEANANMTISVHEEGGAVTNRVIEDVSDGKVCLILIKVRQKLTNSQEQVLGNFNKRKRTSNSLESRPSKQLVLLKASFTYKERSNREVVPIAVVKVTQVMIYPSLTLKPGTLRTANANAKQTILVPVNVVTTKTILSVLTRGSVFDSSL